MSPQAVTAPAAEDGPAGAGPDQRRSNSFAATYPAASAPYRVGFVHLRGSRIRVQRTLGFDGGHLGARRGNR